MKGTPRSAAIRWMASAVLKAWCSDSMTQGPAMRKSRPEPTCTGPISNELLTREIVQGAGGQRSVRLDLRLETGRDVHACPPRIRGQEGRARGTDSVNRPAVSRCGSATIPTGRDRSCAGAWGREA